MKRGFKKAVALAVALTLFVGLIPDAGLRAEENPISDLEMQMTESADELGEFAGYGTESGTEAETETEAVTETETETEAETETQTEIETETETETETEAEAETERETEAETEVEAETETVIEPEDEAGSETGTESKADMSAQTNGGSTVLKPDETLAETLMTGTTRDYTYTVTEAGIYRLELRGSYSATTFSGITTGYDKGESEFSVSLATKTVFLKKSAGETISFTAENKTSYTCNYWIKLTKSEKTPKSFINAQEPGYGNNNVVKNVYVAGVDSEMAFTTLGNVLMTYEDGSTEYLSIPMTYDASAMLDGNATFQAGTYEIPFTAMGITIKETVYVVDPNSVETVDVEAGQSYTVEARAGDTGYTARVYSMDQLSEGEYKLNFVKQGNETAYVYELPAAAFGNTSNYTMTTTVAINKDFTKTKNDGTYVLVISEEDLDYALTVYEIKENEISGTSGEITWKINQEKSSLTISSTTGETVPMPDYDTKNQAPWGVIKNYFDKIVVEDSVSTIGNYAFEGIYSAETLELSSKLTSIGEYAFYDLYLYQETLELPATVSEIADTAFTHYFIGEKLKISSSSSYYKTTGSCIYKMENGSAVKLFYVPDSVKSLQLPKTVTAISSEALPYGTGYESADDNLSKITVASGNTAYSAYDGCLYNADRTQLLYCPPKKESLTLAEESKVIKTHALSGCAYLTSIDFSDSLQEIEDEGVNWCLVLSTVTLPGSLTTIGDRALAYNALNMAFVPASVTSIGTDAFMCWNEGMVIEGEEGSYAETYAKENNIIFQAVNTLKASWFEVPSVIYDGQKHTSELKQTADAPAGLKKDTDYTVTLAKDKVNAGTYQVIIKGKGTYQGSISLGFVIEPKSLTEENVFYETTQDYTGEAFEPYVLVKDGTKVLTEETDYTVTGNKNVNVGDANSVSVAGCGNYTGTVTASITIRKANITAGMIEKPEDCEYMADDPVEYEPVVVFHGSTLVKDEDYTLSYLNNTQTGTATVIVTGTGSFGGTASADFKIKAKTLEESMVQELSSQVYTGSSITPDFELSYQGKTLKKGTDYTVAFKNNKNPGTATVVFKGKGNYTGSVSSTFDIAVCPLGNGESAAEGFATLVANNTDYSTVYTGKEIKPSVKITRSVAGKTVTLKQNRDYVLSYENNQESGKATIIITGKGNYSGSYHVNFTIGQKDVSEKGITVGKTADISYTGQEENPVPSLKYGKISLVKGKDFDVAYQKVENGEAVGEETSTIKDLGTYQIIIKGTGNYQGTRKDKTVAVVAEKLTSEMVKPDTTASHLDETGTATISYTVTANGTDLVKDVDYTETYSKNTAAGTATLTIAGKGNYKGSVSVKFKVVDTGVKVFGEEGVKVEIGEIADLNYTGKAQTPALTVTDGGVKLTEKTDYTVSCKNNTNVGTATVTITGKGKYAGSLTKTFEIKAKSAGELETEEKTVQTSDASVSFALKANSYTYNAKVQTPAVTVKHAGKTLKKDKDYTISYCQKATDAVISTLDQKGAEAGSYYVLITLTGNYEGTAKMGYTISKLDVSRLSYKIPAQDYQGGDAVTPGFTQINVKLGGKALSEGDLADLDLDYENNQNLTTKTSLASVKISASGNGNFTGTVTKTFKIAKKKLSASDVEYKLNEEDASQYSPVYNGTGQTPAVTVKYAGKTLEESTDYTVVYKNNTNVGTASVTVTGKGNYTGSKKLTFKITGKVLDEDAGYSVAISNASYVYSGSACKPTVVVSEQGTVLKNKQDYTVTYKDNKNAGTASVIVTGKGKYTGSIVKNFTITEKSAADASKITVGTIKAQNCTGTALSPSVKVKIDGKTLKAGVDYTTTSLNSTEKGTATLVITGCGNYTGVLAKKQFTVK